MRDESELTLSKMAGKSFRNSGEKTQDIEGEEEESCSAFSYLRGIRDRALAIEFRYRDGTSDLFAYSLLAGWRYNPSVGLLLKFTADVVTLVLIRGSNLDLPIGNGGVNLTERGIQRHRITNVREMDEEELKATGQAGPTIDRIEVAEFETTEEKKEWIKNNAPAFLR